MRTLNRASAIPLATMIVLVFAACEGRSGLNENIMRTTTQNHGPVVLTDTLPRAEKGVPYSVQLDAASTVGSAGIVWALEAGSPALPTGMTLNASGLLAGTPSTVGFTPVVFTATDPKGNSTQAPLDFVVYEVNPYVHAPDAYDTPANDDYANATNLGGVTENAPIVQTTPLSLSSNPASPDYDRYDYFAFTTPHVGEIEIEVMFPKALGRLFASIHGDHNSVLEEFVTGTSGAGGNDQIVTLQNAAAGTWYLKVEAQYKNATWTENAYMFRIRFSDLTIETSLVNHDLATNPSVNAPLLATDAGAPANGQWALESGTLPAGVSLDPMGVLTGNPTETGLFTATVVLTVNERTVHRDVDVRVFDSNAGDYWQRFGEHRYYDATKPNADGMHHEKYCEAMVVAPHPDYGPEGAIYVIGGRTADTSAAVYVFHTEHHADANRRYKLEDIARPLNSERQYLGAAFLQHSYGGYIYVVGGELYSNTSPSSGDYTRVVERIQVSDATGVALATLGTWETVASLPATDAIGRAIEGFAEFGLVADDAASDADDRMYILGGRVRVEDQVGSGLINAEYNDKVFMFAAPTTAVSTGQWFVKTDTAAYTPRRFPSVGMVNGRIYMIGGRGQTGVSGIIEMYQPDANTTTPAIATAGASSFPTLAEPVWYAATATHNGAVYVLNGWKLMGYAPVATKGLQRFVPNAAGTGGTMVTLTPPDDGSGYHSAVFHDGTMWFVTGRDSFNPTPRYCQRYVP